jgi:hypothetical protein
MLQRRLGYVVYFKRQAALAAVRRIFVQNALAACLVNDAKGFGQKGGSSGFVPGGDNAQKALDSGFHCAAVGTRAQAHRGVVPGFFCSGFVVGHEIVTPAWLKQKKLPQGQSLILSHGQKKAREKMRRFYNTKLQSKDCNLV